MYAGDEAYEAADAYQGDDRCPECDAPAGQPHEAMCYTGWEQADEADDSWEREYDICFEAGE